MYLLGIIPDTAPLELIMFFSFYATEVLCLKHISWCMYLSIFHGLVFFKNGQSKNVFLLFQFIHHANDDR